MIFVGGAPISNLSSSSENKGNEVLAALLGHPLIVSAANLFKAMPERKFSVLEGIDSENSPQTRHVYVFQREYATVDPSLVKLVGTDEATTCVGVVIRNQKNGKTSVAHIDSPKIIDMGLTQMLSSLIDDMDDQLDVHLIGGFEDAPSVVGLGCSLLSLIVHSFGHRRYVEDSLSSNLFFSSKRLASAAFTAFYLSLLSTLVDAVLNPPSHVETSSGSIRPASFDRTTRCPDEIARRVRVTVSSMDPKWNGRLLETYDTCNDRSQCWGSLAASLQKLSDSEILQDCSTSPLAEGPDFVENERRIFDYLIKHPDWRETYPLGRNRIFERTPDGGWKLCF